MSGGPLRKLLVGVIIGVLVGAVVKALRGEPAPQFAHHPTVDGGARPPRPPEPKAVATIPAAEPETVVQATLLPVADVAADEVPAPAPSAEVVADARATAPGSPSTTDASPGRATWVEPVDGACPDGYPVKAKLKSGLFHLPGMFAYERTNPDRCYASAADAEADGLRPAKR
jgi:hypothetical protein